MSIRKFLTYISSYAINLALALWESHTVRITELQFCAVSFSVYLIMSLIIKYTPMQWLHLFFSQVLFCIIQFIVYGHSDKLGILGPLIVTFINLWSQSIALALTILIKKQLKR